MLYKISNEEDYLSCYQIFIRSPNYKIEDKDILQAIGVNEFESINADDLNIDNREVCLTHCSNWIHILDDWRYTLLNTHEMLEAERGMKIIDSLSKRYDVFLFSYWSEVTDGFMMKYYKENILKRYVYGEATIPPIRILSNIGNSLKGETEYDDIGPFLESIKAILRNLNIKLDYNLANGSFYKINDKI